MQDPWLFVILVYSTVAIITFIPVIAKVFGPIELHPGGPSFQNSTYFSDKAKKALQDNYDRIVGTLHFWKKQAEIYRYLHYYCLCWTIPASVVVPLLAQALTDDPYSKWLLTIVSAHSAVLLAVHRAFKVMENYRAFREGESSFYDTYRRLLDRPQTFGATETDQLANYLDDVENIRKLVRNAETENIPTLEQAKSQVSNETTVANPIATNGMTVKE